MNNQVNNETVAVRVRKSLPKIKVLSNSIFSAKGGEAGSVVNSIGNCVSLVKVQSCFGC